MCGIFGIVAHNASVPAGVLERATQSLAHRGPDDSGTLVIHDASKNVEIGLGNRRLAILDLSPQGHQPMNDPETGNWIVYNGEIYNFRDVRSRLERDGLHCKSNSDTEVILKAYAHWGENCLHEFRGMFAFAIWDAQRRRLFIARDPIGIKPLYYFHSSQHFIFSSEVRTLLGTGLVPRRLDRTGLLSYLTFGSSYEPDTLVEGVKALPPGCFLTWERGQLKQKQYWALLDADSEFGGAKETTGKRTQLENRIAEMLNDSVRMQMVSDVPVGVFLSGGIDSSSLVGILSRNGIRPSTFSIVFREPDYSEAEYSRTIAQQFRTDHHEITVTQSDFFNAIAPSIQAMDLPTIDGINSYFVSERTRAAGVKVVLSGLGGDEMFAGYSSFHTVPWMERFANTWGHIPAAIRRPLANTFTVLAPSNDQNHKLYALARNGTRIVHPYFLSRMLFTPQQQDRLLWETSVEPFQQLEGILAECLNHTRNLDALNRVSYLEARCYMLNTLLRDSDFMSMAHGLEVRVPLIDHQLARQVLALPGPWKLKADSPKPLLVGALNGQLPEKIVHRPKRGFTLPFERWLRDALRATVEKTLRGISDAPLGPVIRESAAVQVWNDFLKGKTSWSRPWSLYVLQRWCEQHLSS